MCLSQGSHRLILINIFRIGHVAFQIKGNEAYNNMLANSLILHLLLTPGVGSKVYLLSFLKVVILYKELIGMKHRTPCSAFYTPSTPVWGQKVKTFFFF